MPVTMIKYGLTKNLQDYNSERIDAEYMVGEDECPSEAMKKLKTFVATGVLAEPTKAHVPEKKAPKKGTKVSDQTVKEKAEEDLTNSALEEKTPPPPLKGEEKKVAKKKASKKVVKKAKQEKAEHILYDRTEKSHKQSLAKVLAEVCPTWKTTEETKLKAKALSEDLVGVPVYDLKGNVLDSFTEVVNAGMNS